MNIIGHRKIFYTLSAVFLAASIGVMAVWGLKVGIDFTGGSIDEVEFKTSRPSVGELQTWVKDLNLGEVRFQPSGEKGLLIRTRHLAEAEHQALLRALAAGAGGEESATLAEKRFDAVGPTIGQELKRKSLIALVLVIILKPLFFLILTLFLNTSFTILGVGFFSTGKPFLNNSSSLSGDIKNLGEKIITLSKANGIDCTVL